MSHQRDSSEAKSKLYDALYAEAGNLLRINNPCKWKDGKCAGYKDGCCGGCAHLGPNGCTVEALACKLWLCHLIRYKPENKPVVIALETLKHVGIAMGLNTEPYGKGFRASKSESLK